MKIYFEKEEDKSVQEIMEKVKDCAEHLIKIYDDYTQDLKKPEEKSVIRTEDIMMPVLIFMSTILLQIKKTDSTMDDVIDEFSGCLKSFFIQCIHSFEVD